MHLWHTTEQNVVYVEAMADGNPQASHYDFNNEHAQACLSSIFG